MGRGSFSVVKPECVIYLASCVDNFGANCIYHEGLSGTRGERGTPFKVLARHKHQRLRQLCATRFQGSVYQKSPSSRMVCGYVGDPLVRCVHIVSIVLSRISSLAEPVFLRLQELPCLSRDQISALKKLRSTTHAPHCPHWYTCEITLHAPCSRSTHTGSATFPNEPPIYPQHFYNSPVCDPPH